MISVLGLDLDGTVVDSLDITLQLMQEVIQNRAKILFPKDRIVQYFGLPEERIFEMIVPGEAQTILRDYLRALEHRLPEIKCF
ncbi:MAG: HAD family hydrolase, partial [Bdellovibrionales bacterium]|nr:HAD family hydrolase [Bdellovibrionales bacterium]